MGNIEIFRSGDIQAYTPPAAPRKAADPTPAPDAAPKEETLALGDLKKYDVDGNGKITKDEFNATRGGELLAAKAAQEKELFKKLDANGDGKLSSDEFLRAFSQLTGDAEVAKVRDHVDGEFNPRKDADGTIHVDPKVQAGGGNTTPQPAAKTETKTEPKAEPKVEKQTTKEVTVKAGDTLGKIAKANGVTMAELKEANPDLFKAGADSTGKRRTAGGDLIYPGDKIKLPVKADPKAETKAGGGDAPQDATQATLLGNIKERLTSLQAEKDKIAKDLTVPSKQAEAYARTALLDMQISGLQGIQKEVSAYHPNPNLSAEDSKKVQEAFGKIEQASKDLGNPAKMGEVQSQLALAYNFLQNPKLYDPKAPKGTTDPALLNQATATQNMGDKISQLMGEMNALIPDLANPARKDEADARLKLLDAQVQSLIDVSWKVRDFRRTAAMSPEQDQKAADLIKQIDGQAANLSNPLKNADAQAQLPKLLGELAKIGK